MYQVLKRTIGGAALLGILGAVPLHAQDAARHSAKLRAINAVMDFRLSWAGDSTKFDACSVFTALDRPTDFPNGILAPFHRLLDRTTEPCADDASRAASQYPTYVVKVDSLSLADSTGAVLLTVRKHEHRYFEHYELTAVDRERPMAGVRQVRTWGMVQFLPVRPQRQRPAGPRR